MKSQDDDLGQNSLGKQKLSTLLKNFSAVTPQLIRDEIALAKTELKETGQKAGVGLALFGGAALLAVYSSIALFLALIFSLAQLMPMWAAALITAIILLILGLIVGFLGMKNFNKAFHQPPTEVVDGVKYDVKIMREGSSASTAVVAYSTEKSTQESQEPLSAKELRKRIETQRNYLGETVDGLEYKFNISARGKEFFEKTSEKAERFVKHNTQDLPEKLDELKDVSAEFVHGREKPLAVLSASIAAFLVFLKKFVKK